MEAGRAPPQTRATPEIPWWTGYEDGTNPTGVLTPEVSHQPVGSRNAEPERGTHYLTDRAWSTTSAKRLKKYSQSFPKRGEIVHKSKGHGFHGLFLCRLSSASLEVEQSIHTPERAGTRTRKGCAISLVVLPQHSGKDARTPQAGAVVGAEKQGGGVHGWLFPRHGWRARPRQGGSF